jgi:transcriptional regulator with XRE-family HTH domain
MRLNADCFPTNLKLLMEEADMSLYDMEEATGIRYATISNYRSGSSKPSYENLLAIRDALGCELEDFFDASLEAIMQRVGQ